MCGLKIIDILQVLLPHGDLKGREYCLGDASGRAPTNQGSFRINIDSIKFADMAGTGTDTLQLNGQVLGAMGDTGLASYISRRDTISKSTAKGKLTRLILGRDEFGNSRAPLPSDKVALSHQVAIMIDGEQCVANLDSIYIYRDDTGEPVMLNAKFIGVNSSGKVGKQYQINSWVNDHWVPKVLSTGIPYGWETLGAHKRVFFVEGEKDCEATRSIIGVDNLEDMDACVLGYRMNTKAYDFSMIRDKEVYIWPDDDDEGRRFAEKLAVRLAEQSCKVFIHVNDGNTSNSYPDEVAANGNTGEVAVELLKQWVYDSLQVSYADTDPLRLRYTNREQILTLEDAPMPRILRSLVKSVSDERQSPWDIAFGTAMTVVAAASQRKYMMQMGARHREHVSIWWMSFAQPSERKSGALDDLSKSVDRYIEDLDEINRKNRHAAEELDSRIKANRSSKKNSTLEQLTSEQISLMREERDELLKEKVFLVGDITQEKYVNTLADKNTSILMKDAEGTSIGTMLGRYSRKPEFSIFLKGFTGTESHIVSRQGNGMTAPRTDKAPPHSLSIVFAIQPIVLDDLLEKAESVEKGWVARQLISMSKPLTGTRVYRMKNAPTYYDEEAMRIYNEYVYALLSAPIPLIPIIYDFDTNTELRYKLWYDEVERECRVGGKYESIQTWMGKRNSFTSSLCNAFMHFLKMEGSIELDCNLIPVSVIDMVITWMEKFFIPNQLLVMNKLKGNQVTRVAKRIAATVIDNGSKKRDYTIGEFNDMFSTANNIHQQDMQLALDELKQSNFFSFYSDKKFTIHEMVFSTQTLESERYQLTADKDTLLNSMKRSKFSYSSIDKVEFMRAKAEERINPEENKLRIGNDNAVDFYYDISLEPPTISPLIQQNMYAEEIRKTPCLREWRTYGTQYYEQMSRVNSMRGATNVN
jgi:5S rRNA maturation endonuclease (ribonuclease M5)